MTFPSHLAAHVAAWNAANVYANTVALTLAENFRPLIGKKILCNGGSLMERYKPLCPPRRNSITAEGIDCYHHSNLYSLNFLVRACMVYDAGQGHSGACYAEVCVCVGSVENHILREVHPPIIDRRTDYTTAEVLRLRAEVEATEKAFHAAEAALCPFGRYDR